MDPYFYFTWKPINYDDTIEDDDSQENVVISYHKEDIQLFLLQHGFDPNTTHIEVHCDEDIFSDYILHPYVFGSRKRDRLYRIMTNKAIMDQVLYRITNELHACMSFGACALRGEIELFDRISKLVNKLEYGSIVEENIDTIGDSPTEYPTTSQEHLELIYNIFDGDTHPSRDVQPFTIESYVSIFTALFITGDEEKT